MLPVRTQTLSRLACFAVRERFACKETLDKHERSLWLVAGHLVSSSSHGDQAEAALLLALVLHNVATHLSGALKSSVHTMTLKCMITTKCRNSYILFRLQNFLLYTSRLSSEDSCTLLHEFSGRSLILARHLCFVFAYVCF